MSCYQPQGVVTYMSHVEAFATGIKIESSDQSPFWGRSRDQGVLRAARINGSRMCGCNLTLDPENQLPIKSLRRERSSNQAHFLPIKHFDMQPQTLQQATYK